VRDDDVSDVTNQPTLIVESPHEVHVLAHAQAFIEARAETRAAHDETGARHVAHRPVGHDKCALRAEIKRTESLLKSLARGRSHSPADPRGNRPLERVLEVCLKSREDVTGIVDDDIDVEEPEQWS
jgi:hypothetical protein